MMAKRAAKKVDSMHCVKLPIEVRMAAGGTSVPNDLGVEVIILPPGCTGVTQPVDIGYNKSFKNLIRDQYEEWMVKVLGNRPLWRSPIQAHLTKSKTLFRLNQLMIILKK